MPNTQGRYATFFVADTEDILGSNERSVYDALSLIVDTLDAFPTVWALARISGVSDVETLSIVRELQNSGDFPWRVVTPWNLPNRFFATIRNAIDWLSLSGYAVNLVNLSETIGVSPIAIVDCVRRNVK